MQMLKSNSMKTLSCEGFIEKRTVWLEATFAVIDEEPKEIAVVWHIPMNPELHTHIPALCWQ